MLTEFNKHNVVQYIRTLSPPTPTDEEHPAHWWNEQFGMKIKTQVEMMLQDIITTVEERMIK